MSLKGKEMFKTCVAPRKESARINKELWIWFCKAQNKGKIKLTKKAVQTKARLIYQESGYKNFLASDTWYRNWRNKFLKSETSLTEIEAKHDKITLVEPSISLEVSLNFSDVMNSTSDLETSFVLPDFCHLQQTEFIYDSFCLNNVKKWSEMTDLVEKKDDDVVLENVNDVNLEEKKQVIKPAIPKGRCYLPKFREKVLDYAATHTYKQTAMKFKINCNTVSDWVRDEKRLQIKSSTINIHKTEELINKNVVNKTEDVDIILQILKTQNMIQTSDDLFIQWIKYKRLHKIELNLECVYNTAKYCLESVNIENLLWFKNWIERIEEEFYNKTVNTTNFDGYIKYPDQFKVEVTLYARMFSKNSAARVFNISRRRVFDWFNNLQQLNNNDNYEFNTNKVLKCKVENDIYNWYLSRVNSKHTPTGQELQTKSKEIFFSNGLTNFMCGEKWLRTFCQKRKIPLKHYKDDELLVWILTQFDQNKNLTHQHITDKANELNMTRKYQVTKSWTVRFLKRHSNFLQVVPTINDDLPNSLEQQVNTFRTQFKQCLNSVNVNNIGNLDEVPITFLYQEETDGNAVKKTQLLRKTGFERCHALILLCVTADGRLLQPGVVLKGRNSVMFNVGDLLVMYRDDGMISKDVLFEWCERVWFRNTTSPSLLLLDCYDLHKSSELEEFIKQNGGNVVIIPHGASSHIQPLSSGVSTLFQSYVNDEWIKFSSESSNVYEGKCQCPCDEIILTWIQNSYQKLNNSNSIKNSFSVTKLI